MHGPPKVKIYSEKSASNYQYMLRNISEERLSQDCKCYTPWRSPHTLPRCRLLSTNNNMYIQIYLTEFRPNRTKRVARLKVKGRFMGLFQHCGHSAYCILTPNKFPHSSPEAPSTIQMPESSTSEGGNYYDW